MYFFSLQNKKIKGKDIKIKGCSKRFWDAQPITYPRKKKRKRYIFAKQKETKTSNTVVFQRMQTQSRVNIFNSSVVEQMAVNHRVAGSNPA